MNIKVDTIGNQKGESYALTVDDKQYLLFGPEKLVAAMFKHIVLEEPEEEDPLLMLNLMQSAAAWPTLAEAHNANAKMMTDVEDARREARVMRKQLSLANDQIDQMSTELKGLKLELNRAQVRIEGYERLKQQYNKDILKVERKAKKIIKEYERERELERDQNDQKSLEDRVEEIRQKRKKQPKKAPATKPVKTMIAKKPVTTKRVTITWTPKIQEILDTPLTVKATGLPAKILLIMERAGGRFNQTIGDIVKLTKRDLLETKGCGSNAIGIINDWLDANGLSLDVNIKRPKK